MHVFALSTPTVSINVNKRYYMSVNKRISERNDTYFTDQTGAIPVPNFYYGSVQKMIRVRSRLTTGMEDSKDDEKGARYQRGREHCSAQAKRALHSQTTGSSLFLFSSPSYHSSRTFYCLTHTLTHALVTPRNNISIYSKFKSNFSTRVSSQITPAYAFDICIHN